MKELTTNRAANLLFLAVISLALTFAFTIYTLNEPRVIYQSSPTVYSIKVIDSTRVLLISRKDVIIVDLKEAHRLSEEELIVLTR